MFHFCFDEILFLEELNGESKKEFHSKKRFVSFITELCQIDWDHSGVSVLCNSGREEKI